MIEIKEDGTYGKVRSSKDVIFDQSINFKAATPALAPPILPSHSTPTHTPVLAPSVIPPHSSPVVPPVAQKTTPVNAPKLRTILNSSHR